MYEEYLPGYDWEDLIEQDIEKDSPLDSPLDDEAYLREDYTPPSKRKEKNED